MKPFVLRGTVVKGDGLGRKLGFPTANLKVAGALPPYGVYRVLVHGTSMPRGLLGACNVGVRPTLGGKPRVSVEVHIPGFAGNLYRRRLKLEFLSWIRGEKKFPSLAALKNQMRRDVRSLGGQKSPRKIK